MPRHVRLVVLLALTVLSVAVPAQEVVARGPMGDHADQQQSQLRYPRAPHAGYTPRHVRQLFNNCAFASAEMLINKWTEGRRRAPQHTLRQVTGIVPLDGGPTLAQLRRAVARVAGIDMRWSPHGGDPLTWKELLGRLEAGGGALVNVWPAKLPRHYRRWLPALTAGHSVYVERYSHSKNRIWLMDPLGRGHEFRGEWIDADDLHAAMWHSGEFVWAAATPPPPPRAPAISDFDVSRPVVPAVAFSDDSITVSLDYAARRADATLPGLRIAAAWERMPGEQHGEATIGAGEPSSAVDPTAADVAAEDGVAPPTHQPRMPTSVGLIDGMPTAAADADGVFGTVAVPAGAEAVAPASTLTWSLTPADGSMTAQLPTPTVAGDYLLMLELADTDGRMIEDGAPLFEPVAVRVRGPLAGLVDAEGHLPESARQGEVLSVGVKATNVGSAAWDATTHAVTLAVSWDGGAFLPLVPVEAAAGATVPVPVTLLVDADPGRRKVRLTLVDATGAQMLESEPLELALEVTAADSRVAEIR